MNISDESAPRPDAYLSTLLSQTLDRIEGCVYVKDLQGRYVYANSALLQMLALSEADVIGHDDFGLFGAAIADRLRQTDLRVLRDGETIELLESDAFNSQLGTRTFRSQKSPLTDAAGAIIALCGVSVDVTESIKTSERLGQSEERFRMLFDSAPDPVWIVDGYRFVECNQAAVTMLGYPDKDRLRNTHPSELSPEYQPCGELSRTKAERMTDEALRLGNNRFEWVHRRADGTDFWAEVTASAITLDNRRVIYCVWRNISAEKTQKARFRAVFDGSQDAIIICERGTRLVVEVNASFTAITGYTAEECVGRSTDMFHPADELPRLYAEAARFSGSDIAIVSSLAIQHKNGRRLLADITISPLDVEDGRYLALFARDVTQRVEAEKAVLHYQQHLEELVDERTRDLALAMQEANAANQAKSAFLANMSHEIRTPLNAITGMAHLIRKDGLTPVQTERMKTLETSSRHLLSVINAILELSRIDSGKREPDCRPLDVNAIIDNVIEIVSENAVQKGITLTHHAFRTSTGLAGDTTLLQQCLLNYVFNAIKFTEKGGIDILAEIMAETEHAVELRVSVTDSGPGLDEETLARLFQAFEQADNSSTRQYGGSGLGLAITRRYAQLMGGEAGAISMPGAGSTFWFTARLAKSAEHTQPAESRGPEAFAERLRRDHAGARILLAEDELINREIASVLLSEAGLVVSEAADGLEVIELAATQDFDLILMDLQMPQMDGLDATRILRSLPNYTDVPILALTATAFDEDRLRAVQAGMDDFVTKPVDPGTLYGTIYRLLSAPHTH